METMMEADVEAGAQRAITVVGRQETAMSSPLDMLDLKALATARAKFAEFVSSQLKADHHFGVIPGTQKPTLYKAGAEEVTRLYMCAPQYEVVHVERDYARGLFAYEIRCTIVDGRGVARAQGMGACSSYESRYRWRKAERVCPKCGRSAIIKGQEKFGGGWVCWKKKDGCGAKFSDGDAAITSQEVGRVENPDLADTQNTVLKMACKRAHVAAALNLGCASEFFTQDLEDMARDDPAGARNEARAGERDPFVEDSEMPDAGPARASQVPPANGAPTSAAGGPKLATPKQQGLIRVLAKQKDVDDRALRALVADVRGLPIDEASMQAAKGFTSEQASRVIDRLKRWGEQEGPPAAPDGAACDPDAVPF